MVPEADTGEEKHLDLWLCEYNLVFRTLNQKLNFRVKRSLKEKIRFII